MMMSDGAMCIFYHIQDGMQPFRPAVADLDTDKKICCNGTPLYDATDGEVSAALPVLFGSVASPWYCMILYDTGITVKFTETLSAENAASQKSTVRNLENGIFAICTWMVQTADETKSLERDGEQ